MTKKQLLLQIAGAGDGLGPGPVAAGHLAGVADLQSVLIAHMPADSQPCCAASPPPCNRQQLETEKKRRETVEREKEQMLREKEELMLRLQDYEQKTKKAEKGGPRCSGRHCCRLRFAVLDRPFHRAGQTDGQHTHVGRMPISVKHSTQDAD